MSIVSSGQITITDLSDGVGIKTTDITYVGSTSGTTAPTSGWTSTVPSVSAGQFLWTKTVWTYTDNSSETGYSVAMMGVKGDKGDPGIKGSDGTSGIIVSSVAPDTPQTGQLWQDTSTTPQLVKKWTGNDWVIWEFYAQNLKADSLSALSANLGDVTAGTLSGANLSMNLNTGSVQFTKGYIDGGEGRIRLDMNENYLQSLNSQGDGFIVRDGLFEFYSNFKTSERIRTGLLLHDSVNDGMLFKGKKGLTLATDDFKGYLSVNTEDIKIYGKMISLLGNGGVVGIDIGGDGFGSGFTGGEYITFLGKSRFIGSLSVTGQVSQDTPWVTLSSGVKYKFMFSRMYISVDVVGNGSSFMQFGMLPQNLRPISDQFLIVANWGTGTADDRHIQVRASDGAVILWAPKSGVTYRGEVSFTL